MHIISLKEVHPALRDLLLTVALVLVESVFPSFSHFCVTELRQILSSDHELTTFAVSASGEDVYVGGINVLYQVWPLTQFYSVCFK